MPSLVGSEMCIRDRGMIAARARLLLESGAVDLTNTQAVQKWHAEKGNLAKEHLDAKTREDILYRLANILHDYDETDRDETTPESRGGRCPIGGTRFGNLSDRPRPDSELFINN